MLFPYTTDAPIYHWPSATVGLIVANTLIFFGTVFQATTIEDYDQLIWLCLEFDKVNPFQWVSNIFMHADFWHLLSNMVFLWAFGLVAEGKLGWWRFLLSYLGVGVTSSACTQIVMCVLFPSPQFALGASGAIFAVMGMVVIWAPKNNMDTFLWLGIFSRVIELPIMGLCAFYFGMNVLFFVLGGFQMSSEALHLAGLAAGLPLGILMLKFDWVDCEGWDIFNVMQGTEHEAARKALDKRLRKRREENEEEGEPQQTAEQRLIETRNLIRRAITEKQHPIVVALYQKHRMVLEDGMKLDPDELMGLIRAMHQLDQWTESVPLMRMAIQRSPSNAVALRLTLAQILLQKCERPRLALAELNRLPPQLPSEAAQRRQQIQLAAKKQIADGALEIESDQDF